MTKEVIVVYGDERLPPRFWNKVTIADNNCWKWTGCTARGGYGRYRVSHKKPNGASHRIAYEILVGKIKFPLQLDHLCRNPSCVNPAHLEPVTAQINTLRSPIARAAVNSRKTHCPKGHMYNEENTHIAKPKNIRMCRVCAKLRMRKLRANLKLTQKENFL